METKHSIIISGTNFSRKGINGSNNSLKIFSTLLIILIMLFSSLAFFPGGSHYQAATPSAGSVSSKAPPLHPLSHSFTSESTTSRGSDSTVLSTAEYPLDHPIMKVSSDSHSLSPAGLYSITFDAHNITAGTPWAVELMNYSQYFEQFFGHYTFSYAYYDLSTSSSMTAYMAPGVYMIIAGPYNPAAIEGILNVTSSSLTVSLYFQPVYKVSLTETGLSASSSWNAAISGNSALYLNTSSTPAMTAYMPNGTYHVQGIFKNASFSSGTLYVNGSQTSMSVTFPPVHKVTIAPTGLNTGRTWELEISTVDGSVGYTNTSSTGLMIAYLPVGYYYYNAGSSHAIFLSGSLVVTSSGASLSLKFPTLYVVDLLFGPINVGSFTFVGLFRILSNFSAFEFSYFENFTIGTGNFSMLAYLPNGTYSFSVDINGISMAEYFGVTGQNINVRLTIPTLYKVTISETGLKAGLEWSVQVSNSSSSISTSNSSTGSAMTFYLPADTYNYSYMEGVYTVDKNLKFNVNNGPLNLQVALPSPYRLYDATFTAKRVPPIDHWTLFISNKNGSVSVNEPSITGSTFNTALPNGSYNYTPILLSPTGQITSLGQSQITVAGANQLILIDFPVLYSVAFTERNLAPGYFWAATLSNASGTTNLYNFTNLSSMTMSLANGTYDYAIVVESSNPQYTNPQSKFAFLPVTFAIAGTSRTFNVNMPEFYDVNLTETGLNAGFAWSASANNTDSNTTASGSSENTHLSLALPNGTYSYRAYAGLVPVASGSITVAGSNQSISVTLNHVYSVTFINRDTSSIASWFLTIDTLSGSGQVIQLAQGLFEGISSYDAALTNGTYEYSAYTNGSSLSGYVTVSGSSQIVQLKFFNFYQILFQETGLPAGQSWYVNITGYYSGPLQSGSYYFNLSNGTHYYTVQDSDTASSPSISSGYLSVSGASKTVSIAFSGVSSATYSVTFDETGLPSGYLWYANITGESPLSSTSSSISTSLPNGTYSYTIASYNKSYAPLAASGSLSVSGKAVTQNVKFNLYTYAVTFSASGLGAGVKWFVNITGQLSLNSTTSTITANLPNGSYDYTVASANASYSPSKATGNFTVNGKSVSVPTIAFVASYMVTFTESNLPLPTEWYVNITGQPSHSSSGATISVALPNSTYTYTVATSDKGYAPTSYTGSVQVNGAPVSVSIKFEPYTYAVSFSETGLPSGTGWYVNVTNASGSSNSHSGTGTTIGFQLINGTYSYSISSADKVYSATVETGTFTISAKAYSKNVTFEKTYAVTFNQSGLPAGVNWWVNITGQTSLESTGPSAEITLINGNYTYMVSAENKDYAPVNPAGKFSVSDANITVSVAFSLVTYSVVFTETGLPSGNQWYLNMSGKTYTTISSSISVSLQNGTYSFTVSNMTNYYTLQYSGRFVVDGKNITEAISYLHYAYITGTVTPSNATVSINGKDIALASGSFNVSVTAGSYSLIVALKGYTTYYLNFSLNAGQVKSVSVSLNLTKISPSPQTNIDVYYIIAGIIAVIAAAGIAVFIKKRK
jgi:hypothetical protein